MLPAIALSLAAALLFAVAAVLQQRGTTTVPDDEALGTGMVATLVREPVWLAGIGADVAGFGVQAAALAVGSLLLVQPLLVTTLLFALPLGARAHHRRLRAREWVWAVALVACLVVFVVLGEPSAGEEMPSLRAWVPTFLVVVPLVTGCLLLARSAPHGTRRSLLLAVAAGVLLGISAPLTKSAIDGFGEGFWAGVASWELWAMAVTAALGTFWQQSSYQAGDVQTSLPAVTVLKPIVAMTLGLTIYEETLSLGDGGDVLLAMSMAGMAVATVALGRLAAPGVSFSRTT